MTTVTKTLIYKDFDLNMRMHPATGKLMIKKNNDSVKQGVRNLVLTNKYERRYRPAFGCDIRRRLFDLFEATTESNIKSDIETAFKNYMPRAVLLGVNVIGDPDRNAIRVNIVFRPINAKEPVEVTIILERAR